MGNITKSLWRLITHAQPEAAPAGADRLALATQPGVDWVTQIHYVTVADLIGLVPPASVFVDEGLDGDGTVGDPLNVLVDGISIVIDPVTNELEIAAVFVDDGLSGLGTVASPINVLVDGTSITFNGANKLTTIGGAGGAGNSIYSTALGGEPGAPNTGDVDVYTDGPYAARYNAGWIPFGPSWLFTPPVNADFAWVNQGAAVVTTVNGGILLYRTGDGSLSLRIRKKAIPSAAPWFITCAFIPNIKTSNFNRCGVLYRQSSDGKLITPCLIGGGARWQLLRMDNATTFGGVESNWSGTEAFYGHALQWVQFCDDGTNRKVWLSRDGFAWNLTYSETRTTYMTADEVGFFVDPNNGNFGVGIRILHWKESVAFQGIEVSSTP